MNAYQRILAGPKSMVLLPPDPQAQYRADCALTLDPLCRVVFAGARYEILGQFADSVAAHEAFKTAQFIAATWQGRPKCAA